MTPTPLCLHRPSPLFSPVLIHSNYLMKGDVRCKKKPIAWYGRRVLGHCRLSGCTLARCHLPGKLTRVWLVGSVNVVLLLRLVYMLSRNHHTRSHLMAWDAIDMPSLLSVHCSAKEYNARTQDRSRSEGSMRFLHKKTKKSQVVGYCHPTVHSLEKSLRSSQA